MGAAAVQAVLRHPVRAVWCTWPFGPPRQLNLGLHSRGCSSGAWWWHHAATRGYLAPALHNNTTPRLCTATPLHLQPFLLTRALDVARGMAYTHQMGVVHGDLKESRPPGCCCFPCRLASVVWAAAWLLPPGRCRRRCHPHPAPTDRHRRPPSPQACNVLVTSDPADPFGCRAQVSDFGLSRALSQGASHLSTRTYGTVTHMAPELLSSGHLRQASDVYSFGIMRGRPGLAWPGLAGLAAW